MSHAFALPPTDEERDSYFGTGQKRSFLVIQYVAFIGVAVSFAGFATSSYWTVIFVAPLLLLIVEQSTALYTATFRRTTEPVDHKLTVALWLPSPYPSVDIFVPTCGEELELLENTFHHTSRLRWGGRLEVSILDDSGSDEVRALAQRYGFNYVARPGCEFKKAGNLRYAYERTDGEFISILDADFVPREDLLSELMPYFDDASVGIVQSPQYFATTRRMSWVERTAGATQELFYRFVQPSRDRHGAAICVGSSAIYKRAALDRIGGFPKICHSEDVYTGFELGKIGISTRYVPTIVSKGLCPDNLDSFIAQQYRWCEGSMALLASRDFHLNDTMSVRARLCFWSGFLHYIVTAMNALIFPLPAIIMTWFYPAWVKPLNMVWLIGIPILWFALYPIVMTGHWRIEVLRLQIVYGFAHAFSIAHVFTGQQVEWKPTRGGRRPEISAGVRRFYTWYLGVSLVLLSVGLAIRCQHELGNFWPMLVFSLINLYVAGPLVAGGIRLGIERSRRGAHRRSATQRQEGYVIA